MYAKIKDGVVIQTQPYEEEGFIFVEEDVYYGQIQDGEGFVNPAVIESCPASVERYQARVALHNAGYLEQVEALMINPDTPMIAREAWVGASSFRRDSVTVKSMGNELGLSESQIDDLFIAASKIEG